jgi:hypothetical protein
LIGPGVKDQTRETGRNGAPPFSAGVEMRFHIALACTQPHTRTHTHTQLKSTASSSHSAAATVAIAAAGS